MIKVVMFWLIHYTTDNHKHSNDKLQIVSSNKNRSRLITINNEQNVIPFDQKL